MHQFGTFKTDSEVHPFSKWIVHFNTRIYFVPTLSSWQRWPHVLLGDIHHPRMRLYLDWYVCCRTFYAFEAYQNLAVKKTLKSYLRGQRSH